MKNTLVLGASTNPHRYSYIAIHRLRAAGHGVIAVGRGEGTVADITISEQISKGEEDIDTITLYLRAELQPRFYNQILESNPKRIIFNPGSENIELAQHASAKGIETLEACTLVMLSINTF